MRIYYDIQDEHFVEWSLYAGNKKPGRSFKSHFLRKPESQEVISSDFAHFGDFVQVDEK